MTSDLADSYCIYGDHHNQIAITAERDKEGLMCQRLPRGINLAVPSPWRITAFAAAGQRNPKDSKRTERAARHETAITAKIFTVIVFSRENNKKGLQTSRCLARTTHNCVRSSRGLRGPRFRSADTVTVFSGNNNKIMPHRHTCCTSERYTCLPVCEVDDSTNVPTS
ncbi:hypothetical protein BaRGS_00015388 [Batillaria attramentaria]|uniref:Uncharacterized protein n=1 Tax=Batillaria attramentaria TaxID=370345 RepID=A0ABD0L1I5_9CAEN